MSTACAPKAIAPSIQLTIADTAPAADPARPVIGPLRAPAGPEAAAERAYLTEAVVRPLTRFSVAQEATTAAERQRADGLVGKVRAHNTAVAPKRWWWPF